MNDPHRLQRATHSELTPFIQWDLLQFLEPQVTPLDLGADQFLFAADAVDLQADETLAGEAVLEVGAGYAV